jgi:hypothetical protein
MRVTNLATIGACLLLATQLQAAPARPHVKRGISYADARAELIRQGFDPVRIVSWNSENHECRDIAWPDVCAAFRETMNCFVDVPVCQFLYRRRSDGRYWTVNSLGEPDSRGRAGLDSVTFDTARPTPDHWIDDLVILGPDGRRLRFGKSRRKAP